MWQTPFHPGWGWQSSLSLLKDIPTWETQETRQDLIPSLNTAPGSLRACWGLEKPNLGTGLERFRDSQCLWKILGISEHPRVGTSWAVGWTKRYVGTTMAKQIKCPKRAFPSFPLLLLRSSRIWVTLSTTSSSQARLIPAPRAGPSSQKGGSEHLGREAGQDLCSSRRAPTAQAVGKKKILENKAIYEA